MLLPIDSSQLPGLLKQHFLAHDCCNLGQTKQSLIDGQRALEANVANVADVADVAVLRAAES